MKHVAPLASLLGSLVLMGCAEAVPQHVDLLPEGENVDFAYEAPSPDAYTEVGQITSVAEGPDEDSATLSAKNDMRNKAAALGASIVTIDEDVGEPVPLTTRLKVKLVGRAFKPAN